MDTKKNKTKQPQKTKANHARSFLVGSCIGMVGVLLALSVSAYRFEKKYAGRIYPNVTVGSVPFGGSLPEDVLSYWKGENEPFEQSEFQFSYMEYTATVSGASIRLGYDAELSAEQAYSIGRSGNTLADTYLKYIKKENDLSPLFRWDTRRVEEVLMDLASYIDNPAEEALFKFQNGKVTAFRPSKDGRKVNVDLAILLFKDSLADIGSGGKPQIVTIPLTVEPVRPKNTTGDVNDLGIKDHLGTGYSEFAGSIQGRIHNVALSAGTLHGVLIPPGKTLSFNQIVGEISQTTGYRSAYIIKDGRTILGDGGGVCQTSTTLFRAALDAGLPVLQRYPHAYRVKYYEQGGYKAGLDATVFAPSVDLVIQNDTPAHILIQATTDLKKLTLTIDLYGTRDGRIVQILNHRVWDETPPPDPLYQDDPTLPEGEVKQIDWAAWGAKASFDYRVTRDGDVLQDKTFYSTFRPWQAVYLRGVRVD